MVIYSSIGGTTRKVAQRVAERLGDGLVLDARAAIGVPPCRDGGPILLFCPTYGDEEAEDDFERLLLDYDWAAHGGAGFAFCELGLYTGYEDFGHGLAGMVHDILVRNGLHELVPPLSIDAVPVTDWGMVDAWADLINVRRAVAG